MLLRRILRSNVISTFRFYTNAPKLIDVKVDEDTSYATVTLNKRPVNSLNAELLTELFTAFTSLESQNVRGMILTSSMESVFSAGLDINELYQPKPDRFKVFYTALQDMWINLYCTSFPTVAVINGHALAGGCLLATSCEYRIMLNNFTIGFNETKLGITAPDWVMKSFENIVGPRDAEYGFTTGRIFTTDEALKNGIVDELGVDKADALKKAEDYLNKYEMISQLARFESKKYFRAKDIEVLKSNRQNDLQIFQSRIMRPTVQKDLEAYLINLKNRKRNA